jgi:predicted AAA+ superfamily ATPase
MENSVAVELKRKLDGTEIYYWKDYRQNEVDFVVKAGEKIKQIIQVTYANKRDEIKEREVKSLLRASSVLKCKKLVIITWDYENFEKINGKTILFVPLWKWFLYG